MCGARGGFGGPGKGVYARLSEGLRRKSISSLRMSYRHPNVLLECALDTMVGVAYLKHCSYQPVMLVGHSFGGAVVITAGALSTWLVSLLYRLRPMERTWRGSLRRVRCWWCTAKPTPGYHILRCPVLAGHGPASLMVNQVTNDAAALHQADAWNVQRFSPEWAGAQFLSTSVCRALGRPTFQRIEW